MERELEGFLNARIPRVREILHIPSEFEWEPFTVSNNVVIFQIGPIKATKSDVLGTHYSANIYRNARRFNQEHGLVF